MTSLHAPSRRRFLNASVALGASAALAGGTILSPRAVAAPAADGINLLGPKPGYSPQVGTLVSMLTWMRPAVTRPVKGLTVAQLDYLFDANANSIGALLLHLAATERLYQINTFEAMTMTQDYPAAYKEVWGPAMDLGDAGRKTIKGHELDFYLGKLTEVREHSLAEFKKRDDAWLMTTDEKWPWGPTNNYCKWFHVCEHESHHAGQIDLLIKRVPGAKA